MTSIAIENGQTRKPIRVLHIIEATLGGTLRYLENISAATEQSDLVLGLAYGTNRADSRLEPLLEKVETRGWKTYSIDMRREIEPWRDFLALLALRTAIKDFGPDIIHCHSSKAGALGRIAAQLQWNRPARLYTPNALAVPMGAKYLKIEKLLGSFTDGFVAVSESEAEEIRGYGLDRHGAIYIVYPLIDSNFFSPQPRSEVRRDLGLDNLPIILGIGRLMPQKDPKSFVIIMKLLHAIHPEVQGIWLGSGADEIEFKQQIRDAGMENVIQVVPWVHDVRPYIAAANVLLSTSVFESFGYMVVEALAMEVPVVATNITGTCDIMRGELKSWLYPARDHARAVELLTVLMNDPARTEAIGVAGRKQMQARFSKDKMLEALIETYIQALKSSSAAS